MTEKDNIIQVKHNPGHFWWYKLTVLGVYCQLQVYSLKVLMVELDNVQAVQAASYFLGIMHTDDNYEYGSIMCQAGFSLSICLLKALENSKFRFRIKWYKSCPGCLGCPGSLIFSRNYAYALSLSVGCIICLKNPRRFFWFFVQFPATEMISPRIPRMSSQRIVGYSIILAL